MTGQSPWAGSCRARVELRQAVLVHQGHEAAAVRRREVPHRAGEQPAVLRGHLVLVQLRELRRHEKHSFCAAADGGSSTEDEDDDDEDDDEDDDDDDEDDEDPGDSVKSLVRLRRLGFCAAFTGMGALRLTECADPAGFSLPLQPCGSFSSAS